MDLDHFRSIVQKSGVDLWTLIDTAISVASSDCAGELRQRRVGIVGRLYAPVVSRCRYCTHQPHPEDTALYELDRKVVVEDGIQEEKKINDESAANEELSSSPEPVDEMNRSRDGEHGIDVTNDAMKKVLAIKQRLHDPHQSEDSLVVLLQRLAGMDITFNGLKETDIGRHVNLLRKHSSSEVRRLAKQLVRRWKDLVDEWVSLNNTPGESTPIGPEKNNLEPESKRSTVTGSRPLSKPAQPEQGSPVDPEKLALSRKRLHENYQQAEMAKKQRTVQVMEIHDAPMAKKAFLSGNRGANVHGKRW